MEMRPAIPPFLSQFSKRSDRMHPMGHLTAQGSKRDAQNARAIEIPSHGPIPFLWCNFLLTKVLVTKAFCVSIASGLNTFKLALSSWEVLVNLQVYPAICSIIQMNKRSSGHLRLKAINFLNWASNDIFSPTFETFFWDLSHLESCAPSDTCCFKDLNTKQETKQETKKKGGEKRENLGCGQLV
jgi:hypothetical protein